MQKVKQKKISVQRLKKFELFLLKTINFRNANVTGG